MNKTLTAIVATSALAVAPVEAKSPFSINVAAGQSNFSGPEATVGFGYDVSKNVSVELYAGKSTGSKNNAVSKDFVDASEAPVIMNETISADMKYSKSSIIGGRVIFKPNESNWECGLYGEAFKGDVKAKGLDSYILTNNGTPFDSGSATASGNSSFKGHSFGGLVGYTKGNHTFRLEVGQEKLNFDNKNLRMHYANGNLSNNTLPMKDGSETKVTVGYKYHF